MKITLKFIKQINTYKQYKTQNQINIYKLNQTQIKQQINMMKQLNITQKYKFYNKQNSKITFFFNFIIKRINKKMQNLISIVRNMSQKQHETKQKMKDNDVDVKQLNKGNKQQNMSSSLLHDKSSFKNSILIRQDCLVSKFLQLVTGTSQKLSPSIKINPLMLINKIQQCKNEYTSILTKQRGFDILLDGNGFQQFKIQDCIGPTRPNSEIYKRISKNFFQNNRNNVDQCFLFQGVDSQARIQTSIGNHNNPGLFMIIAISLLDQKYKQFHQRFDLQFSFMQYRDDNLYDLINYTQKPLKVKQKLNSYQTADILQFGQQKVKVCTFLQFIKLLRIALFNNKQRDFKTTRSSTTKQQTTINYCSSFLMKITVKKYNISGRLISTHQTVMIDLQSNSSNKKQKLNINKAACNRSILDYLLIDINNSNPNNKSIHYHMVQRNLLLGILSKFMRRKDKDTKNTDKAKKTQHKIDKVDYTIGGQIFYINSIILTNNAYKQSLANLQNIKQSAGAQWQGIVCNRYKFNKYFQTQYSQKILRSVIQSIRTRKYLSLRDLYTVRQFYSHEAKKIIQWINQYKNLIIQYLKQKYKLKYSMGIFTAYQLQLIGKCIKSDNFKQFYNSKSYLALPRQIKKKTQQIKQVIIQNLSELQQLDQKYKQIKKKQTQVRRFYTNPPTFLTNMKQKPQNENKLSMNLSTNKFKTIGGFQKYQEFRDFDQFINLRKYILQYFYQIWEKVTLTDERTITEEIIFQDDFLQQITNLKTKLNEFIVTVEAIDQANIKCLQNNILFSMDNYAKIMRSLNQSEKGFSKFQPSKTGKSQFGTKRPIKINKKSRKQNFKSAGYLPKIKQIQANKQKSSSIYQKKKKEQNVFHIKGNINFQNLILNPKKSS